MKAQDLKKIIREIIDKVLAENAPAAPKPTTAPPTTTPGKPKPRRPLGNPDVKPGPKAGLKEEEMLQKIVARFKSKK